MAAPASPRTAWHIVGELVVSCNCDWGCPCQFNALPTHGYCEDLVAVRIDRGHFGGTSLDGVTYAELYHWDGAIHHGNGWRQLVIDEQATTDQRHAIEELTAGLHGHPAFEIFSAMAPNAFATIFAPIELVIDLDCRHARLRIPNIGTSDIEPIRNPVTGTALRARIELPNGFGFKVAEMGDSVRWQATAGEHLTMAHEHTYAQLNRFDWSSDGTTR